MRRTFLPLLFGFVMVTAAGAQADEAKTTLTIKGMTCGGCVAAVKLQLRRTAGVTAYEVSLDKGEADVAFDPAKTDPGKIAESVSATGYAATVKGAGETGNGPAAAKDPETAVARRQLQVWEPVDAAFSGCSEGVCGLRGRNAQAVVQPGAKVGQLTYCPVSGAVFRIKESSRHADVHGRTLYLCCEACARYYADNQDRVLALRGLSL
jgi:copper chaperone